LETADGFCWQFHGVNKRGVLLIPQLAHAMRLSRKSAAAFVAHKTKWIKKIAVTVLIREVRWPDLPHERANEIACNLGSVSTSEKTALQLTRISQIVANSSEKNGGLLVHGALAELNGIGVILAGPGGVGKTTASKRLPHPWRSLSDDTALIVKSPDGTYWAHPWPTWSRCRQGDMSGSWDVQTAVKIGLICMLRQCQDDRISLLPLRQVISELVDVSGQTFTILANGMSQSALRCLNLMRFHNAVVMAKKLPVCRLEISKNGEFWEEIKRFLNAPIKMRKMKK
jgi:SynChlorMet cassette protein ScmC